MTGKVLRRQSCPIGDDCPAIERPEGGGFDVIGTYVPDESLPAHERRVHIPDTMLPELASLDVPNFRAYRDAVRQTPGDIYRVQTLTCYGVPSDDQDYLGYLNGAPEPTSRHREAWFAELEEDAAAGRVRRNLHVVTTPLTDYLRYAFEWGYAYNVQHGQDVRILDLTENPAGSVLLRTGDYWVLERQHVVLCRYDQEGKPLGTVAVEAAGAAGYIAAAEMAWELAAPFTDWWAAHPCFHRAKTRAA